MVDRITARTRQIGTFPLSDQSVPEYRDPAIREVIEGLYRMIYEVADNDIRVLAVIHGARLFPPQPPRAENVEQSDAVGPLTKQAATPPGVPAGRGRSPRTIWLRSGSGSFSIRKTCLTPSGQKAKGTGTVC